MTSSDPRMRLSRSPNHDGHASSMMPRYGNPSPPRNFPMPVDRRYPDARPRSRSPIQNIFPSRHSMSPHRELHLTRSPMTPPPSWWNHDSRNILDGTVKEYIDDFTGLMEVEIGGELLTGFFHATAIWLTNPIGNPYGEPVKFTDVLGQNTATTRENTNISLENQMPIGSEVLLKALVVKSDIVQLVLVAAWPKSTEPPPQPQTENEVKILEKKHEYFLKEFHNKLESKPMVEATFPGCIRALYPDVEAAIWEIRDDNFGVIEIKGTSPQIFRFFALFHREDMWLRDGKRGVDVDFFKHKPLSAMCKAGQPVNLIARSILTAKGVDLVPAVMELQAVVVSLNPDKMPVNACRPTW
jgi:hypothetical protein